MLVEYAVGIANEMYQRGLLPDRFIFDRDESFAVSNGEVIGILTEWELETDGEYDGSLISDLYSYLAHASGREVTNDFEAKVASDMLIADKVSEVYQAYLDYYVSILPRLRESLARYTKLKLYDRSIEVRNFRFEYEMASYEYRGQYIDPYCDSIIPYSKLDYNFSINHSVSSYRSFYEEYVLSENELEEKISSFSFLPARLTY